MKKTKKILIHFWLIFLVLIPFQGNVLAEKLGGAAGNTAEVGFYEAKPEPPTTEGSKSGGSFMSRFPQTGEEMAIWGISALGIILVFIAVKKLTMKGGGSHG